MPTIAVTIADADTGATVHTETRRAFNAGVRASEAAVRAIARREGQTYTGETPQRMGHLYARWWRGDATGRLLLVNVTGEAADYGPASTRRRSGGYDGAAPGSGRS